jgi:archaellum biogenesis ATPase FlaH
MTIIADNYFSTSSNERYLLWALLYDAQFYELFPDVYRSDFQRVEIYDFLAKHYTAKTDEAELIKDFRLHFPILSESMDGERYESLPSYYSLLDTVRKESKELLRQRLASLRDPTDGLTDLYTFRENSHGIEKADDGFPFYNAVQLKEMAKDFKPLEWLIPGIIQSGLIFLAGVNKAGKSYLALQLAYELAIGGYVLGYPESVDAGQALYLDLENARELTYERLEKMAAKNGGVFPSNLFMFDCQLTDGSSVEKRMQLVENWLKAQPKPKLVILDTQEHFSDLTAIGRESDYSAAVRKLKPLRKLANEYNVTIMSITHASKGSNKHYSDPFDRVIGSAGITATADETLVLETTRMESVAKLHVTGRRVRSGTYKLNFDESADTLPWRWLGDAKLVEMSDLKKNIVDLLRSTGGMTAKELHESWFPDSTLNNIRVTLTRLTASNMLSVADGKYKVRENY